MMTVSGIRGIVGETLTSDFIAMVAYTQAKITHAKKVVVGRDTRPTGAELARAVFRGIRAAGAEPVDIGIAPTPTTCVATAHLGADTGIILTASHNPNPYNGYKMVHGSGRLFNERECNAVYDALDTDPAAAAAIREASDTPPPMTDCSGVHIDRILAAVDCTLIRKAGIRIAIDATNGAAGAVFPALLEQLGVGWVGVHTALDGNFTHNPEPRPEHLTDLSALLARTDGLWGGFAFDPDADRLAPMAENGAGISEEMTLAFALDALLARRKTPVATNLSTSMVIDDVAAKHGVRVVRTRIGEANVVEGMIAAGCAAGGEGNGGVIFPEVSTVRDGLTALALILEAMARSGSKLGALATQWKQYPIVKEKISIAGRHPADILKRLKTAFAGETLDETDGLKLIRPNGWVHIRASNTEPILRCYAEADTEQLARELANMVLDRV